MGGFEGGGKGGDRLEFEGEKYVVGWIGWGMLEGDKVNMMGKGVVVEGGVLKGEGEGLEGWGDNLKEGLDIWKKGEVMVGREGIVDGGYEGGKGDGKVGSRGKGMGGRYREKIRGKGVGVGDMVEDLEKKYGGGKGGEEEMVKGLN